MPWRPGAACVKRYIDNGYLWEDPSCRCGLRPQFEVNADTLVEPINPGNQRRLSMPNAIATLQALMAAQVTAETSLTMAIGRSARLAKEKDKD